MDHRNLQANTSTLRNEPSVTASTAGYSVERARESCIRALPTEKNGSGYQGTGVVHSSGVHSNHQQHSQAASASQQKFHPVASANNTHGFSGSMASSMASRAASTTTQANANPHESAFKQRDQSNSAGFKSQYDSQHGSENAETADDLRFGLRKLDTLVEKRKVFALFSMKRYIKVQTTLMNSYVPFLQAKEIDPLKKTCLKVRMRKLQNLIKIWNEVSEDFLQFDASGMVYSEARHPLLSETEKWFLRSVNQINDESLKDLPDEKPGEFTSSPTSHVVQTPDGEGRYLTYSNRTQENDFQRKFHRWEDTSLNQYSSHRPTPIQPPPRYSLQNMHPPAVPKSSTGVIPSTSNWANPTSSPAGVNGGAKFGPLVYNATQSRDSSSPSPYRMKSHSSSSSYQASNASAMPSVSQPSTRVTETTPTLKRPAENTSVPCEPDLPSKKNRVVFSLSDTESEGGNEEEDRNDS